MTRARRETVGGDGVRGRRRAAGSSPSDATRDISDISDISDTTSGAASWNATDPPPAEPAARLIDTTRFAHASEAEMARILDFYEVRWDYEPTTFPILWNLEGDVVESFAPDFYLPDFDVFLEMTTLKQRLVRKKNRKLRRLKELYPDIRIKLFYARDFRAMMLKYGRLGLAESLSGTTGQVVPERLPAAAVTPAADIAGAAHAAGPADAGGAAHAAGPADAGGAAYAADGPPRSPAAAGGTDGPEVVARESAQPEPEPARARRPATGPAPGAAVPSVEPLTESASTVEPALRPATAGQRRSARRRASRRRRAAAGAACRPEREER